MIEDFVDRIGITMDAAKNSNLLDAASQFMPGFRDKQVNTMAEDIKKGVNFESDNEGGGEKRKRAQIELFAKAAAKIVDAEYAGMRMNRPSEDGSESSSKSREDIQAQLLQALLDASDDVMRDMYGQEFANENRFVGEYDPMRKMKGSERRLFLHIAPKLIAEARGRDDDKSKKFAMQLEGVLTDAVMGNFSSRNGAINKSESGHLKTEAMFVLQDVSLGGVSEATMGKFIRDEEVSLGDKIDFIQNTPLNSLQDMDKLMSVRAEIGGNVAGRKELMHAVQRHMKGNERKGLGENGRVYNVKGNALVEAKTLSSEDRTIVEKQMRNEFQSRLLASDWEKDSGMAFEALQIAGEMDGDVETFINAFGERRGLSFNAMSEQVLRAFPDYVLHGKHYVEGQGKALNIEKDALPQIAASMVDKVENYMITVEQNGTMESGKSILLALQALDKIMGNIPKSERAQFHQNYDSWNSLWERLQGARELDRIKKLTNKLSVY